MSARDQISHLMNMYSFTIDTGDLEGFAGLFEYGRWGVEGAEPFAGKQQSLEGLLNVRIYEDGTPKTKHVTSNIDIEVDEESGSAKSQSYVTIFQQTDTLPLQVIFSGHYFDEFERVGGRWRFKTRCIRNALVGDVTAHLRVASDIIPDR